MVPGSARNWMAINAVQQFSLNQKMKTKNMTTLQLRRGSKNRVMITRLVAVSSSFAASTESTQKAEDEPQANSPVFTRISFCDSCSTLPIGITENGLISGLYFDADGNLHAFNDRNDNYLGFDVPAYCSLKPAAATSRGQTAGDYLAADGIDRPFVRSPDGSFSLRNGAPGASSLWKRYQQ